MSKVTFVPLPNYVKLGVFSRAITIAIASAEFHWLYARVLPDYPSEMW